MYKRFITQNILDALLHSPVVLISGARQTGKTTLVQQIAAGSHPARYVNLDDAGSLSAATSDPAGFLAGIQGPVVIDEVQRAPALFPAMKSAVDRDRQPGRFLLTGSSDVMLLPKLSESLAGRMELLTMWPLAQAEIEGSNRGLIDLMFEPRLVLPALPPLKREDLIGRIVAGGYPEPLTRTSEARRRAWFSSYITTIVQSDVRDIANIEGLTDMPRLLALLSTRTASLLNTADISRSMGIPYSTLHRYMSLLQATYLVQLLPPWSTNLGARLVRTSKLLLNDTGLAASLAGLDAARLQFDSTLLGPLLENFVTLEIVKAIGPSVIQPKPYHYGTVAGAEIDLLLEAANGQLVGVEIKASSTVNAKDFRGLRTLGDTAGNKFHRGLVIYTGEQAIPFGERLHAVPIQALWA